MSRMRYEQFREAIRGYLKAHPAGATWTELRKDLGLKYRSPCYSWIYRMENEVGLRRTRRGPRMVWTIVGRPNGGRQD